MLAALKRYLLCWIQHWVKPLLNKNDPVARAKLSEKYWGLVFSDIDDAEKLLYVVYIRHMKYEKCRKGGWTILVESSNYDGTYFDFLEPF